MPDVAVGQPYTYTHTMLYMPSTARLGGLSVCHNIVNSSLSFTIGQFDMLSIILNAHDAAGSSVFLLESLGLIWEHQTLPLQPHPRAVEGLVLNVRSPQMAPAGCRIEFTPPVQDAPVVEDDTVSGLQPELDHVGGVIRTVPEHLGRLVPSLYHESGSNIPWMTM